MTMSILVRMQLFFDFFEENEECVWQPIKWKNEEWVAIMKFEHRFDVRWIQCYTFHRVELLGAFLMRCSSFLKVEGQNIIKIQSIYKVKTIFQQILNSQFHDLII